MPVIEDTALASSPVARKSEDEKASQHGVAMELRADLGRPELLRSDSRPIPFSLASGSTYNGIGAIGSPGGETPPVARNCLNVLREEPARVKNGAVAIPPRRATSDRWGWLQRQMARTARKISPGSPTAPTLQKPAEESAWRIGVSAQNG
ncbi:hypothetical protein JX266_009635 [Neoarthrinium moseri]|nr:hypothetical protein JX266_009635 [Neoarthrinium moseri]